ncbi:hypothetical protein SAMN05216262_11035 [Colwellia chukchiensis]|uniref:LETM1-like protein n=1 Tax=Colwellia chukchiensis TaxID=641665 RepID=A0A1H7PT98_9GAMM|nr:hypothetical protein [Colwellia chukchiensis]SEL38982.1 hypothetical protein SAMN05216262_11035 [Colwellia chukchiensis]
MKVWRHFHKAPIRVLHISKRRNLLQLKRSMIKIKIALAQEKAETKAMLSTYKRYTKRAASAEEMRIANQQFIDILKGLGIGVVAILPFAPITIPLMIKIARLVGVEILPSSMLTDKKNNVSKDD